MKLDKLIKMGMGGVSVDILYRFYSFCQLVEKYNGELVDITKQISRDDYNSMYRVMKTFELAKHQPSKKFKDARYRRVVLSAKGKRVFDAIK